MGIFKHPAYLVVFLCTLGQKNLWKKKVSSDLPEEIVHLLVMVRPFNGEKKFIKEYDKIFGKDPNLIVQYICEDLPWQAFPFYYSTRSQKGQDPENNFGMYSGEDVSAIVQEEPGQVFQGLVCTTLHQKLVDSKTMCVISSQDVTESVFSKRGEMLQKKRINERVMEAINAGELPRKCPEEDCATDFTRSPPDEEGDCPNCDRPVCCDSGETMDKIYNDAA